ncbi:haloacid dehalogenase type II [Salinibacterium sp. NYA9b]
MTNKPVTIFFDVNETLSDLSPVGDAFEAIGAGRGVSATWFNTVLRDGFALTSTGSQARFLEIARTNARDILRGLPLTRSLESSVDAVLDAFSTVQLHDDVAPGIRALHAAGHRLFTLSNGPASTAERLLREAGLSDLVDGTLSVEEHAPWKPARGAYEDALTRTNAHAHGAAYLVAVHPWDIHGAAEAGLSTAWVNRGDSLYPPHFRAPTETVLSISELAEQLDG